MCWQDTSVAKHKLDSIDILLDGGAVDLQQLLEGGGWEEPELRLVAVKVFDDDEDLLDSILGLLGGGGGGA